MSFCAYAGVSVGEIPKSGIAGPKNVADTILNSNMYMTGCNSNMYMAILVFPQSRASAVCNRGVIILDRFWPM